MDQYWYPKYECVRNNFGTWICQNLNLTSLRPYFLPESKEHPKDVDSIELQGNVSILTNNICEYYHYLTIFYVQHVGLQSIQKDAFKGCRHLFYLELSNNNLTTLDVKIFEKNPTLGYLFLDNNLFEQLNFTIFKDLGSLEAFSIRKNNLIEFSTDKIPIVLPKLLSLMLQDNNLSDLNEFKIHEKFPKLMQLYFNGNPNISNTTMNRIRDYVSEFNVDCCNASYVLTEVEITTTTLVLH